jgi:hypothetical protein
MTTMTMTTRRQMWRVTYRGRGGGKHLSFDGRMLHGAPSDAMADGSFERQCAGAAVHNDDDDDDAGTRKILARRRRRVTFLVNVWLNYRPYGVEPFPDGMIGKLSKCNLFGENFELFDDDGRGVPCDDGSPTSLIVRGGVAYTEGGVSPSTSDAMCDNGDGGEGLGVHRREDDDGIELTKMVWPMGGGKEDGTIEALVPLELIRAKGEETTGSDVAITWIDGFVLGGGVEALSAP